MTGSGELTFTKDLNVIFPGLAQLISEHRSAGASDDAIISDIRQKAAKALDEGISSKVLENTIYGAPAKTEE